MKNLSETLRNRKTGYGHFNISIEMDGKELSTTTTNAIAIDASFDDCYDDEDNDGRYYESRLEAQDALVSEILIANDIMFAEYNKQEEKERKALLVGGVIERFSGKNLQKLQKHFVNLYGSDEMAQEKANSFAVGFGKACELIIKDLNAL